MVSLGDMSLNLSSTHTIKMSTGRAHDPEQMQRRWTIANKLTFGISTHISSVTRSKTGLTLISSAHCNQAFLVQKYCILSVIIQHFHFPLPSSGAYFQLSVMFFYRWWRRGLHGFQGNWYVAVWACGWKFMDLIAVFMNNNNINAHIALGVSSVQVSQKLQIIVVWGVFVFFLMSWSLFVADFISVWEKPWNVMCDIF